MHTLQLRFCLNEKSVLQGAECVVHRCTCTLTKALKRVNCCCSESAAQNQHDAIQDFIKGTIAEKAPIVPISAQLKYNVDAVCEYIVKRIPVPVRDFTSPPQMIVIRSFDVNKPGSEVEELRGGVAGGSILQVWHHRGVLETYLGQILPWRPSDSVSCVTVASDHSKVLMKDPPCCWAVKCCHHATTCTKRGYLHLYEQVGQVWLGGWKACLLVADVWLLAQGVLRKGQEVEVRPGIVSRDSEGRATCVPIYSRIITLLAEQNDLQYAVPGGLIGVGTTVGLTAIASLSLTVTDGPTTMHLPETFATLTQQSHFSGSSYCAT